MAGFVAVIADAGSDPVSEDEITVLARRYQALRGSGGVRLEAAGRFARVATIESHVPVELDRDTGSWCATVGSMYAPGRPVSARLETLDGQFATIRYLAAQDSLEVITDPFGMQDLYVASSGGRTYISTSALVLARHLSAAPDPLGTKLFLRTGVQFGPVTHWEGVERVEPATALRFEAGRRLADHRYWTPTIDPAVRAMGLRETVDHCVEIGRSRFEQRLKTKGLISADITGGFDSRMVTALLDSVGAPFETLTVAEEPTDARSARMVAESAGWDYREQAMPSDWRLTPARLTTALGWADGRLDVFNLAEVLWRQHDRSGTSRRVLTGGGGENFGPSPWMQELWRAGRTKEVNFDNLMNMRVFLPLDVSPLAEDPRSTAEPYVREVLQARAQQYGDELNTTKLDVIHAYREVGHFGAYRSAGEAEVRAELPCYYRDFWTAAVSSNYRWRNGHRLHRGIIERLNPAVAAVETQRGGPAELVTARNAVRFVPYYVRLGRTAIRKLRGRSNTSKGSRTAATSVHQDAVRELRRSGVLDPRQMASGGLYDRDRLERLIAAGEAGTLGSWTLLGRVATVELAQRAASA